MARWAQHSTRTGECDNYDYTVAYDQRFSLTTICPFDADRFSESSEGTRGTIEEGDTQRMIDMSCSDTLVDGAYVYRVQASGTLVEQLPPPLE